MTSVSRLLGLGLTPGKLRGLQRISNANGTLTMVALDQNNSMFEMLKKSLASKGENRDPNFQEIVEAKVHLARCLAPAASGLLVDAYYGVWNTVASFALPRDVGLLIRVEKSGADKNSKGAPLGEVEPGMSVAKIKQLGADAVKLLAQFEPTETESAEHQFQLVKRIYEECQKHDILFLLEPVAFPFGSEKKDSKSFVERKAKTVIDSAKYLSNYCDVYKAEYPASLGLENEGQQMENLHKLNEACSKPWVLLSAGVDFPQFKKQVEMSTKAGANGILGGRAFWKEYFQQEGLEAREKFAKGECFNRVKQLDEIVRSGKPWWAKYGLTLEELHGMRATENWHFRYGSHQPAPAGAKPKFTEGSAY